MQMWRGTRIAAGVYWPCIVSESSRSAHGISLAFFSTC